MKIHWFEAKQIDRVTNFSTETELIESALRQNIDLQYYCTFAKKKIYFNLPNQINYLGQLKNRYLKYIEFHLLVVVKAIQIVLLQRKVVLMVNQDLIRLMLPAYMLNAVFRRDNKFIVDIRTTPTNPASFDADMISFHKKFKYSIKFFDGFSFITPFMEHYVMQPYKGSFKSVNWSSGVNVGLFKPEYYKRVENNKTTQLFYHGGLSISRGNLDVIKAVEPLIKAGYAIELVQIGILVDDCIKTYIKEHNLSTWCKLLDPVSLSEIPQMIVDCDLPVLPFPNFMAWRVSSPIKLMEYLAMGKKVLAPKMESFTDVFGIESDLVYYYNTSDKDQVPALTQKIKEIIDSQILDECHFHPESRAFVESKYTWQRQAEQLFNFCNDLWIK